MSTREDHLAQSWKIRVSGWMRRVWVKSGRQKPDGGFGNNMFGVQEEKTWEMEFIVVGT